MLEIEQLRMWSLLCDDDVCGWVNKRRKYAFVVTLSKIAYSSPTLETAEKKRFYFYLLEVK